MISISVVVPVYNVEPYISRCINSIIEQDNSLALLECLVIDDCSQDHSIQIARSIVDQYKGDIVFNIISHSENKGLSVARNTGIEAASGDYIFFMDSDDWLPRDSIYRFVKVLQDYPDVDMITGNSFRVADNSALDFDINEPQCINNFELRKSLLNHNNITHSAWNKLFKASVIAKYRFPEGVIFEDIYWSYFVFQDVKQAVIIPDVTYVYENGHLNSIINTAKTKQKASLHLKSISIIGNSILDALYKDLYSDSIVFLLRPIVVASRLQFQYKLKNDESRQFQKLRKRIIRQSATGGRWFLAFFSFVLLYIYPSRLFNIKWVRRHYDKIEMTGRKTARFFERFHNKY